MSQVDFRETLYTISKDGSRKWVYAELNRGYFRSRRTVVALILLIIYLILPWITFGDYQAVFLDITQRRFVFFGNVFLATDTRFLFLILGGLAFSLFFFSAILGRVWCGWACPETVFLEFVYRPIEFFFEGTPAQRKKRDLAPLSGEKILRKSCKWFVYAVISWYLASTALAYFLGRENLIHMIHGSPLENFPMFCLTLAMMAVVLFQFGWFREQFCTVVCPYARFQSVLLDQDSLIVGYDVKRGEPRGKIHKGKDLKSSLGDCIDCGACVRVCPTGIDIRNGLQLECIQCAACADACDSIMTQVGRGVGLIRYDTEASLEGGNRNFFRPRVVIYSVLLFLYGATFFYFFSHRALSEFTFTRKAGNDLYSAEPNGLIVNVFTLHISNKDKIAHHYDVSLKDDKDDHITLPLRPITIPAGGEVSLPAFIEIQKSQLKDGKKELVLQFIVDDQPYSEFQFTDLGPI